MDGGKCADRHATAAGAVDMLLGVCARSCAGVSDRRGTFTVVLT